MFWVLTCKQGRSHFHHADSRAAQGAGLRGHRRRQVAHQEAGQELRAGSWLGGRGGAQSHRLRSCCKANEGQKHPAPQTLRATALPQQRVGLKEKNISRVRRCNFACLEHKISRSFLFKNSKKRRAEPLLLTNIAVGTPRIRGAPWPARPPTPPGPGPPRPPRRFPSAQPPRPGSRPRGGSLRTGREGEGAQRVGGSPAAHLRAAAPWRRRRERASGGSAFKRAGPSSRRHFPPPSCAGPASRLRHCDRAARRSAFIFSRFIAYQHISNRLEQKYSC